MNDIEIKIYCPLVPISYFDTERTAESLNSAIDELLKLHKNINVTISPVGEVELNIYKVEDYQTKLIQTPTLLFSISISDDFDNRWENWVKDHPDYPLTKDFDRKNYPLSLADNFFNEIFYLLILVQIAKPGSIKITAGDIFINGEFIKKSSPIASSHKENSYIIEQLKWPTYKELSILKVLTWFKENNLSFYRYSRTKVERALNAFTYLFDEDKNEITDLFWSLVGIEAIYCSGKEGKTEQIREKTQILLGPIIHFKKRLREMYDFRSSLVHGSLDIPPSRFEIEDEESKVFNKELINSSALAQATLTVSIQELVIMNKCDLVFKYSLEN